jgi:hypothetical protein
MRMNVGQDDRTWAENARSHFPEITSYGYGLPEGVLNSWGDPLSDQDVERIITARNFLCGFKPLDKVSYRTQKTSGSPTSTALKNLLQKYSGVSVYEGDVILAASALGIPTRNYAACHAQIGVSKRQYKDIREVIEYERKHPTR